MLNTCRLRCQSTRGVKTDIKQQTFRVANFSSEPFESLRIGPLPSNEKDKNHILLMMMHSCTSVDSERTLCRILLSNRILSPPGSDNATSQVALSDTMNRWIARQHAVPSAFLRIVTNTYPNSAEHFKKWTS
jgi:hypothetical protein